MNSRCSTAATGHCYGTGVSIGVRFAEDGKYRLINLEYAEGQLVADIYDAETGSKEQTLSAPLSLPVYER